MAAKRPPSVKLSPAAAVPQRLEDVPNEIVLEPEDWMRAPWRPRQPVPRPPVIPFDKAARIEALWAAYRKLRVKSFPGGPGEFIPLWHSTEPAGTPSAEEARFWLALAGKGWDLHRKLIDAAAKVSREVFEEAIESRLNAAGAKRENLVAGIFQKGSDCGGEALTYRWMAALIAPEEFADVLHGVEERKKQPGVPVKPGETPDEAIDRAMRSPGGVSGDIVFQAHNLEMSGKNLIRGFRRHVLRYLTDEELIPVQERIKSIAGGGEKAWRRNLKTHMLDLARAVRLVDAEERMDALVDAECAKKGVERLPASRIAAVTDRRMDQDLALDWLAHTGTGRLDDYLMMINTPAVDLHNFDPFAPVRCAAIAPAVLGRRAHHYKADAYAKAWFKNNPAQAIAGLAAAAGAADCPLPAAAAVLAEYAKDPAWGPLLRDCIGRRDPQVARILMATVFPEPAAAGIDLPKDLLAAFAKAEKIDPHPVHPWCNPAGLPPLRAAGVEMGLRRTILIIQALRKSAPWKPHVLIEALVRHAAPSDLEAFALQIFKDWNALGHERDVNPYSTDTTLVKQTDDPSAKEKWPLYALGFFGGDAAVMELDRHILAWPSVGRYPHALASLDALGWLASGSAIGLLLKVAAKSKTRTIKDKAGAMIELAAQRKGLDRDALEDMTVPDLGLDREGGRVFDYGTAAAE